MPSHARLIAVAAVLAAALAACGPRPVAEADKAPAAEAPKAALTLHEIMLTQVAPAADVLWKAVGTVNNVETKPETDADWARLRQAATILTQAPDLLGAPGLRVVNPGVKIQDEGQEGNLAAAEIQKRIDADHAAFVTLAKGLQNAGVAAIAAIDKKSVDGVSEVGGTIDEACEACHAKFWYPAAAETAAK